MQRHKLRQKKEKKQFMLTPKVRKNVLDEESI